VTDVVIRTSSLRKVYRTGFFRRAYVGLAGLDLEVRRGEVFGYIGPNGAGKTTTLKLLMGLNFPTSGTAEILGRPLGDTGVLARVGFLPERPYFYDYLTAAEFLGFYGQLHGMPSGRRRQRIEELLALVHLESARNVALRKFSKGMLQRIGLAQALINDPELVVLDEPSSGLDPMGRMLVRDVIRGLKERGTTVLFSSHVLSDVEQISDRVGIVAGGVLRQVGPVSELVADRVTGVEVMVSGLSPEAAAELGFGPGATLRAGTTTWTVPDLDRANGLLRAALLRGGTVVDLSVRRETLEQLFLDEVATVERVAREAGTR
jgi:ABC-2 type transport system ATP-binding protein